MDYLNRACLEAVSPEAFRATQPYPWTNLENSLTPEGYEALRASLPDTSQAEMQVGKKRSYGQAPHDRFLLHYRPGVSVAPAWQEFLAELQGPVYQDFLRRVLGPGINNWGWAIVIAGILLNLVTLPTRLMMMKSSLKMMRIQPKVEALKKRYAHLKINDPKKAEMNTEMMALYKAEGVNMYGGCLPMLIQMPLLYAIYEVLENAIELRQAHWLWIPDLSSPDPTYVLPALFILTMFLVQFITPSPGMDPAQRRMMAFVMPVIFGFTLFHFPSGLALYWFVGNLINLGIQVGINQSGMGKEMHAIAARRAAKKASGSVGQRSLQRQR